MSKVQLKDFVEIFFSIIKIPFELLDEKGKKTVVMWYHQESRILIENELSVA